MPTRKPKDAETQDDETPGISDADVLTSAPNVPRETLPQRIQLNDGREVHLTTVGLPNTCAETGADCPLGWYATHRDAALSGAGYSPEWALANGTPLDEPDAE